MQTISTNIYNKTQRPVQPGVYDKLQYITIAPITTRIVITRSTHTASPASSAQDQLLWCNLVQDSSRPHGKNTNLAHGKPGYARLITLIKFIVNQGHGIEMNRHVITM